MSYSGFENEDKIREALHNKQFSQLNSNLQRLIKYSFIKYTGLILCTKQAGRNKSDLLITIEEESHTYSIKNFGKAHSVHQEPIEKFIDFLENQYNITTQIKDDLRFFIWGDGTYYGTGEKKDRQDVHQLKKDNPKIIERLKIFFEQIEEDLFKRFCFEGAEYSSHISEFIYFGDENQGVYSKSDIILNWVKKKKSKGVIPVSRLTFQAWNRALNNNKDLEKRRGNIQLKWGTLPFDLRMANDEYEEIKLVKMLNKNKNSVLWSIMNLTDTKNYYAVRCTKKILSKISSKKVLPKTDVFIIESFNKIILDKYYLDEDMLLEQKINYIPISNSGISVKEKDSKSFTYQKMTIETFYKIFENYELGCAIEYYTTEKDYHKHPMMEKAWKTNKNKIIYKLNKLAKEYNYTDILLLDTYQNIKQSAIKLTEYIINNDSTISDFIFKGIGAFDNPYYAIFIYKEGKLSLNNIPNKYSITTGAGRSNGKYTVAIKP